MQFELNIYGENDKITKKYGTDKARYGVFEEAIRFAELAEGKSESECNILALKFAAPFCKKLFPGLTDEDLKNAVLEDMINLIYQVCGLSKPIADVVSAEGDGSKN